MEIICRTKDGSEVTEAQHKVIQDRIIWGLPKPLIEIVADLYSQGITLEVHYG